MVDALTYQCPRCGADQIMPTYSPCPPCRAELIRIYNDRNRVRLASLAHLVPERFNRWLNEPADELDGDTPWQWIDAGFTDHVIRFVKTLKRARALEDD